MPPKVRITLTFDEAVVRAVKDRVAQTGLSESEVVELALRRSFGLDLLESLWAKAGGMSEKEAMDLALEAQQATRRQRR